jgi:hypothetical protein
MKITDHIRLGEFSILEEINMPCFNWKITPVGEWYTDRSQGALKVISLCFEQGSKYKTGIKLSIEKLENKLLLSSSIEFVCKNIMFPDEVMDSFIFEVSIIAECIMDYLKKRYSVDIQCDPFFVREPFKYFILNEKQKLLGSIEELLAVVSSSEPQKQTYANNGENVILFGTSGRNLAELFKEANIAEFTEEHGGFVLWFREKNYQMIQFFANMLAYNLAEKGFSSKVYPIALIEYYWMD